MNTIVSAKGQITLPRFVRQALGLKPGAAVSLTLDDGELRLRPSPVGTARRLAGSLRRYRKRGVAASSVRDHVKREVGRAAAAEGTSG